MGKHDDEIHQLNDLIESISEMVNNRYICDQTTDNVDIDLTAGTTDNLNLPIGDQPELNKNECQHEWIEVHLLNTTVYNCKHCGVKKEDISN